MATELNIAALFMSAVAFWALCVADAASFNAAYPSSSSMRSTFKHERGGFKRIDPYEGQPSAASVDPRNPSGAPFSIKGAHELAERLYAEPDTFVAEVHYGRKEQVKKGGAGAPPPLHGDDTVKARKAFRHFWKESIGSGHALLATRADYQKALRQTVKDLGIKRVRMHGIFDDDMSVVLPKGPYAEAAHGERADDKLAFAYEFFNVAQIYDFFLEVGVKPIVELSFMPGLIANCTPTWGAAQSYPATPLCQTVMHYQGIVMPPFDNKNAAGARTGYSLWEELVEEFAKFLVSRYGVEEVRSWHFEVWNELWGMPYTKEAYLALYESSYKALKKVDSELKVGGPATMQCQFTGEFVKDNTKRDSQTKQIIEQRFDFVSSHLYPTDPNCTYPAPGYNEIDCFANTIKRGVKAAKDEGSTAPFFVTEYNAGLSNAELLYSSYAAAFIFRNVPLLHDHIEVWSYWTFSDVFEESGMHSGPFEGYNYGIQTQQGVKKPAYRAFQLLKEAGEEQLETRVKDKTDAHVIDVKNATVTAFSTIKKRDEDVHETVTVFASNFAPQFFSINHAHVNYKLRIALIDGETEETFKCHEEAIGRLIDEEHGNVYKEWERLGKPLYPTAAQLSGMHMSSHIAPIALNVTQTYRVDSETSERVIECHAHHPLKAYAAMRVEFKLTRK